MPYNLLLRRTALQLGLMRYLPETGACGGQPAYSERRGADVVHHQGNVLRRAHGDSAEIGR